ncbi:conserved hypothetical protein [Talaromyces stipitatus ATCC 10500]|uniref:Kinetochore protein mis14 n=1 Tax=Talaromyces stipitatus (strain ATCC 10500 / CBS 375.48 / QM 6759 / NRRL 1006) TaxID=441959 RepID=B8LUQ1_TALSN|nr:uncharacterized protein TSTA_072980 [Talaromyces stipitatus ATCC 10500]EED23908.1 conserved hypothetical protein [Talaromyces stipitatus ATCC 10500]
MQSEHYRKIELQSPADLTYLYTNAIALSRQKLDLHFPPSASYSQNGNQLDPMKERVKELVDDFIRQTYTYASDSLSINGLEFDSASLSAAAAASKSKGSALPFPATFSAPDETVEYEPYDGKLASRVSSLYAQLESLTTTVAQLRRDAPRKTARMYAGNLKKILDREDEEFQRQQQQQEEEEQGKRKRRRIDNDKDGDDTNIHEEEEEEEEGINPEYRLDIPFGTAAERERWHSGEIAEIYTDTLRTLLRLQGEELAGTEADTEDSDKKAISTTVATAERAERAVEVVEKMV